MKASVQCEYVIQDKFSCYIARSNQRGQRTLIRYHMSISTSCEHTAGAEWRCVPRTRLPAQSRSGCVWWKAELIQIEGEPELWRSNRQRHKEDSAATSGRSASFYFLFLLHLRQSDNVIGIYYLRIRCWKHQGKERKRDAVEFSLASWRLRASPCPNPGKLRGSSGVVPVLLLWWQRVRPDTKSYCARGSRATSSPWTKLTWHSPGNLQ